MSAHTEGRLVVKQDWLIPEAHAERPIGGSTNPIHDRDNYAHVVVSGRGRYHDIGSNLRRLAAAWNACEGMTTEAIEALAGIGSMGNLKASELDAANQRIAKLEALVAERDAMLGKRPCQNSRCNELNAARALLREVSDFGLYVTPGNRMDYEGEKLTGRIHAYLDPCDKPREPT